MSTLAHLTDLILAVVADDAPNAQAALIALEHRLPADELAKLLAQVFNSNK